MWNCSPCAPQEKTYCPMAPLAKLSCAKAASSTSEGKVPCSPPARSRSVRWGSKVRTSPETALIGPQT